jgi:MFS family permease
MRLWRYCIAGFLFNLLAFVFWTVVPIRAVGLGANPTQLALLQTSSSVVYVLTALFSGGLSDRVSRSLLARLSTALGIAVCAATVYVDSLNLLYVVAAVLGFSGSIYWPSIQGAVGAESEPSRVEQTIGWFNVSWSVGKTLGFVVTGWLAARSGGQALALWIVAGICLPILVLYPADRIFRRDERHETGRNDTGVYRTIGYVANFLAFGVGNVFSGQFYKYAQKAGVGGVAPETLFGLVLGAIYGTQTLMFVVLQRGSKWTYRRGLLYGAQLLAGGAAVAVTFVTTESALIAAAAAVGVGLGFANASSIYYSLHGPAGHGKYAGVHEAVLGAGSFLVPLAGGRLADLNSDLRMPYWLVGGLTLLVLVIQEAVYRRRPRS